jgi:hypothetical protein
VHWPTVLCAQEGMELEGQGRGLCISFSWFVNDRTLVGGLLKLLFPPFSFLFLSKTYQA